MHAQISSPLTRPAAALADYDFLRSTYEMLIRAAKPDYRAINNAFAALEAAHARLQASHEQFKTGRLN